VSETNDKNTKHSSGNVDEAIADAVESAEELAEMIDSAEDLAEDIGDEGEGITADGELVGDEGADEGEEEKSELELALEAAEAKATEHHENLLRMAAEMDNLRKRTTGELERARKFGIEKFAREMLNVKDSLEMGVEASKADEASLESIREGSDMTLKQLNSALEKFSITVLDPVGEVFNPEQHEAMAMQPSEDAEPNTVLTVIQKGYQIHDRVLRPARVIVAKEVDS